MLFTGAATDVLNYLGSLQSAAAGAQQSSPANGGQSLFSLLTPANSNTSGTSSGPGSGGGAGSLLTAATLNAVLSAQSQGSAPPSPAGLDGSSADGSTSSPPVKGHGGHHHHGGGISQLLQSLQDGTGGAGSSTTSASVSSLLPSTAGTSGTSGTSSNLLERLIQQQSNALATTVGRSVSITA